MRAVNRAKALAQAEGGRADHAAFPLLIALSDTGPMRSSTLAEAVFSDPSTISRHVAHLVELGYVERRADPDDGRAYRLAVTHAGNAALEAHRRSRDDHLARLTSSWSEADRRTLAELVDRLAAAFRSDLQECGHDHRRSAHRRPAQRQEP
jgi:DNA-binding MarR family transcriptional regulator